MNLEEKVWNTCEQYQMVAAGSSVLVGLSGGADSVCLLLLLSQLSRRHDFSVRAFHMHHGIRGEEADRDRDYSEELCRKWGVSFDQVKEDVPEYARIHKVSQEEAGRILRYQHMRRIAKEYGCEKIAVAHHGDDQIETVLMNFFRGSGSRGLCGMAPVSQDIIRPLLFCTKKELLEELEKKHISYCCDSTNEMNIYMRNRIRNELMPWLEEYINPQAGQHILQTAWQQRQIQEYMELQIQEAFDSVSKPDKKGGLELGKKQMKVLPAAIQTGVVRKALEYVGGKIKDVSMVHIVQALALFEGRTGSTLDFPYHVQGRVGYEQIFFYLKGHEKEGFGKEHKKNDDIVEFVLESGEEPKEVNLPQERAVFRYCEKKIHEKNVIFPENTYTKWLNCDKIRNSLQIRTRRSRDVIAVCKSGGHKKLKDFFIDCKIPADKRDDILLLADGSEVIWVIGYRLSEAYKVVPGQEKVLQVEFIQEERKKG